MHSCIQTWHLAHAPCHSQGRACTCDSVARRAHTHSPPHAHCSTPRTLSQPHSFCNCLSHCPMPLHVHRGAMCPMRCACTHVCHLYLAPVAIRSAVSMTGRVPPESRTSLLYCMRACSHMRMSCCMHTRAGLMYRPTCSQYTWVKGAGCLGGCARVCMHVCRVCACVHKCVRVRTCMCMNERVGVCMHVRKASVITQLREEPAGACVQGPASQGTGRGSQRHAACVQTPFQQIPGGCKLSASTG